MHVIHDAWSIKRVRSSEGISDICYGVNFSYVLAAYCKHSHTSENIQLKTKVSISHNSYLGSFDKPPLEKTAVNLRLSKRDGQARLGNAENFL